MYIFAYLETKINQVLKEQQGLVPPIEGPASGLSIVRAGLHNNSCC